MSRFPLRAILIAAFLTPTASAEDRPDLIFADFEGKDYHPWVATGNAFGVGPARGALAGQMAVEGFEGKGLVNSFVGGDDSTGSLTSPPFLIERKHLNFLIGGGKYPGETCLDLLIDGRVARTATGPNDRPGGSERLDWASWDVAEFAGREAMLRIVDRRRGGWGHINVDQIFQSDRPRGLVPSRVAIAGDRRFLLLPIDEKAKTRRVKVLADDTAVREFDIKLAEGKADFLTSLDLSAFRGRRIEVAAVLPADSKALAGIVGSNAAAGSVDLHHEAGRPRFHFTSSRGWLNDPNGLVFFDGEYHLFYQHNPYGWDWGNMHWGHAVSRDLVRWSELPIAIYPHEYGDWAFSGSAVVDLENSSGFGDGTNPPLVAAFTSTGRGECIVFSRDRGRTWSEFSGNPVVRHAGRDPRLFWHEPTRRWVMAVYDEEEGRRDVVFQTSPDLKTWTFASRIGGFYECPDFFELPVQGSPGRSRWVLSGADGAYLLGGFDGKTFSPEPGGKQQNRFGNFYAAQTFSDEPKGRRVQIGWAQGIAFPGQPFNQQMTLPCELTLRATAAGDRLFAEPVAEVDSLRVPDGSDRAFDFGPGDEGSAKLEAPSDLLDVLVAVEFGTEGTFTLELPGATVSYDVARRALSSNGAVAPLDPAGGVITLRILVDRGSVEVFANQGRVAISRGLRPSAGPPRLTARFTGRTTRVRSLKVAAMGSSWR